MLLHDDQVRTGEVKQWKGIHLLHFRGSSCSQKVRVLLREKGLGYTSHPVNLVRHEHVSSWFLGINPRGVVPVLVHDGRVHIESNDILEYLDRLPSEQPPYFPQTEDERLLVKQNLEFEDSIHVDLRNLTMGFIFPRALTKKSEETLNRYEQEGASDPKREKEVKWWRNFAKHGVPAETALQSYSAHRKAFEWLEDRLAQQEWLIGDRVSVLEIAWFITTNRLKIAGYPLEDHPNLLAWHNRLKERSAFCEEVYAGALIEKVVIPIYGAYRSLKGTTLRQLINQYEA